MQQPEISIHPLIGRLPNFSTLNRFETVQNGIFSLHQIAKNPGNQGFPGFFKYGPEGNRTPVRKPIHSGISHYSHSIKGSPIGTPDDRLAASVAS